MKCLAFILLLPLQVLAASAIFSTGGACDYNNITVTQEGNVVIFCKTGAPPPVVPPIVTPPPPPPPVAANVNVQPPIAPGASLFRTLNQGEIVAFPLQVTAGQLQVGEGSNTPENLRVRLSLSKIPGDVAYATSPAMAITTPRGGVGFPGTATNNAKSGVSISWNLVGGVGMARITAGEQWYLNMEGLDNSGHISYSLADQR